MSDQTPPPNATTIDPYKHLRIIPGPNGNTLTGLPEISNFFPRSPHPVPILTKDITINQSNNTWARLFLPHKTLDSSNQSKLPLVVWFHGGGFILFSAATTFSHDYCANTAIELNAIVVSIEYRLAPEHRLPAAYDDAVEALLWIKTSPDEWLTQFADFSKSFLMGGSAGANIVYHAALTVAERVDDLEPIKIRGLILHQPFFGGSKRTGSELRLVNDRILPLCCSDLMWELSLPIGADRDHEYCNPTAEEGSSKAAVAKIRELGWKVLVDCGDKDPLMDRQVEFIKMLQEKGVQVASHIVEGGYHGVEFLDPSKCKALYAAYKCFISSISVFPSL
ncbi:probable carboxylesterase 120 [Ricinus communis]|uniref:probable carboxylesterase 120 n=1 Tax=Ricinus communis TaxID=3988 RepID=UPI00201A2909|nr:probable carboxylesterase 120 [Ricinus communis]